MTARKAISLAEALNSLYSIVKVKKKPTSTVRLQRLADYCVQQLAKRGLTGAETDVTIPGGGREKKWDVAWKYQNKYRLAISLKSILSNLGGTVPNRIDDLIGEVANVQMYSPEIVTGYIMVFDVSEDGVQPGRGITWCDLLAQRLAQLSGRKAPYWSIGTIEAFALIRVNFSSKATILDDESSVQKMFDELIAEVKRRNPSLS
ncbi:MAG: hypothetical protein HYS14_08320 [Candidatus Rokubacteria bacterium]|nr:hypothetical protein [Candidatus Rokubacteria bacterium]